MTQSKSQVLVNLKTGDKVVFDVEKIEDFNKFRTDMNLCVRNEIEWIWCGDNAVVRLSDIYNVFYFPEGYSLESEKGAEKPNK